MSATLRSTSGSLDASLNALSKKDSGIFITTLHGDLAKENILAKNGKIIFIDWCPYIGIITDDLVDLIKKGFVQVDSDTDYKYKNKFLNLFQLQNG